MADTLTIAVQDTPNPNAAKFTLNRTVAAQGTTYRLPAPQPGEADGAPACPATGVAADRQAGDAATAEAAWAQELLRLPGITQVFALQNFISVTKTSEADWRTMAPQVEQILRRAFG